MLNIFLFLGVAFLATYLIGRAIDHVKIPWIFAALIFGSLIAVFNLFAAQLGLFNPLKQIIALPEFSFLAQLGMYFLLFVIGFEIDFTELKKTSRFIVKSTFFIIPLEALFGSMLVHFVFGYPWAVALVVSLSFATVGEAILVPILEEFKMVNSKLGQSILGIGLLDDIIEIFVLVLAVLLIGSKVQATLNISLVVFSLFVLFAMTFGLTKLRESGKTFHFQSIEILFLVVLFLFFLFIGIGEYAHAVPIAAFLSGIGIRTFVPNKRLETIESEVKTMCYSLFAPIFFIQVGASLEIGALLTAPLLVLLVVLVSNSAKLLGSYIMGRKELGLKKSILLGIGISARFSTSIIIIKMLFDSNLIDQTLFSIIVASSVIFTFIIPLLFSALVVKWKVHTQETAA